MSSRSRVLARGARPGVSAQCCPEPKLPDALGAGYAESVATERDLFFAAFVLFRGHRFDVHHFVSLPSDNADSSPPGIDPQHTLAIKRWTREYLKLPEAAVVSVHEFGCRDAGCPLLQTVIAVLEDGQTRTWKLTRPRMAVTKMMIQQTLAMPPETT